MTVWGDEPYLLYSRISKQVVPLSGVRYDQRGTFDRDVASSLMVGAF